MYTSQNIIWIKNVKRNQGNGWAYEDIPLGSNFLLNWPSSKPKSASTPQVGDIMVLFQKPNTINGMRNYAVHMTHLVSFISEDIHNDDENPNHRWCREVQLLAKANPINSIPNPGYYNFFKPNRGLTNPIINLENSRGLNEKETKVDIWKLFKQHFDENVIDDANSSLAIGLFGEVEGDKIVREHIKQELTRRNSKIVFNAKEKASKENNGRLLCECCNFDFLKVYGPIGSKFIECHHKIHLSIGMRITNIDDLALVCSNCHRMLHRKIEDDKYHTIQSLKNLITIK